VAEPFSKWGGTSARQKNYIKFLWFVLATVRSQALKYDVLHYLYSIWRSKLHYFRQNYAIMKTYQWTTWNSNRLGCYRGDPSQQRHSGSSSVFPLRKFYTVQMFVLLHTKRMQLRNHADTQPVKRSNGLKGLRDIYIYIYIYTVLNLECWKGARTRWHCANCLVLLRICAP